MKSILEQHFWFEGIQFNKNDFPVENPVYIDSIEHQSSLFDDYNLFDVIYGNNRYVKLSELLKANTEQEWNDLNQKVSNCKSITIVNDTSICNRELEFIEKFYIESFYAALKQINPNCFVLRYTLL
ncbi:MAG: hypothetical protein VZR27_11205 [Acutalibacteraceae bacterium]|nr:hypothetical protein [Acutalibacteraceae bacterium]